MNVVARMSRHRLRTLSHERRKLIKGPRCRSSVYSLCTVDRWLFECWALQRLAAGRWALLSAIGTEHATITWLGPQQSTAIRAFMEESASVEGHLFDCTMAAMGTLQLR